MIHTANYSSNTQTVTIMTPQNRKDKYTKKKKLADSGMPIKDIIKTLHIGKSTYYSLVKEFGETKKSNTRSITPKFMDVKIPDTKNMLILFGDSKDIRWCLEQYANLSRDA